MSRSDPQVNIRIPADIREWLIAQSRENGSSQTSEVIRAIRERMDRVKRTAET